MHGGACMSLDEIYDFEYMLEVYICAVKKFDYISYGFFQTSDEKNRARILTNIIAEVRNTLETVYYEDLFDLDETNLIRYEENKKVYQNAIQRILENTKK
jgi:hypothetical protein